MNDLERYIIENASNWDDKKAPPGLWDTIAQDLDKPKQKGKSRLWIAGMVGLLLLSSITGYFILQPNDKASDNETIETPLLYAELSSFSETEKYYLSAILASQKELDTKLKDESLTDDLEALDKIDIELRREYINAHGVHREQILQELIHNHQTKLNLLLNVLEILNEQNKIEENVF